jgi:uncharacterized membrane protein (UPF0127 family)
LKIRSLVFSLFISVSCSAETLIVHSKSGDIELNVELPLDNSSRAKGLMNRKSLGPKEGMLFVYERQQPLYFWMKNTLVPLDMLFIDQNGVIVDIHQNAEPLSLKTITSSAPALAAIEILGGQAQKLGIARGDRISHRTFKAQ